jgi:hypothetical protein
MSKFKRFKAFRLWLYALGGATSLMAPIVAAHAADRSAAPRQSSRTVPSQLLQAPRSVHGSDLLAPEPVESLAPAAERPDLPISGEQAARTLAPLALWVAAGAVRPIRRGRPRHR